jgi:hypothetical protein
MISYIPRGIYESQLTCFYGDPEVSLPSSDGPQSSLDEYFDLILVAMSTSLLKRFDIYGFVIVVQ